MQGSYKLISGSIPVENVKIPAMKSSDVFTQPTLIGQCSTDGYSQISHISRVKQIAIHVIRHEVGNSTYSCANNGASSHKGFR